MNKFFNTLGGKTLEELPAIATSLELTAGVGAFTATWVNNNSLSGYTNVVEYFNGSVWVSGATVPISATTATVSGLEEISYNVRVSVFQQSTGRFYPSAIKNVTPTAPPVILTFTGGTTEFVLEAGYTTLEYLIVGGGASGAASNGSSGNASGGGGAGGYLANTINNPQADTYTITVGAG